MGLSDMTLLRYSCYLIAVFCSLIGLIGRMPYLRSRQARAGPVGGGWRRGILRIPLFINDDDENNVLYAAFGDDEDHRPLPIPDLPVTTISV
jgi:hypothetical protein